MNLTRFGCFVGSSSKRSRNLLKTFVEVVFLAMEMSGKIRRMHLRDKMSLHAIARQTGLSGNTLRRWLREPDEATVPTYQRTPATGKLSVFHVALVLTLKADAHRNKQNRRTAKALFAQIKADGHTSCYSRVTDFMTPMQASREATSHHSSGRLSGRMPAAQRSVSRSMNSANFADDSKSSGDDPELTSISW